MSFEAELKSRYSEIHRRLSPPPARTLRPPPKPAPKPQLPPQSTEIKEPELPHIRSNFTLAELLKWVSACENVPVIEMESQRRDWNAVIPRQIFYHLAKTFTKASLPMIGRALGHRDHTTVLSGIRRMAVRRSQSRKLNARVASYEALLTGVREDATQRCLCLTCPYRKG